MIYRDRQEAGQKIAQRLERFRDLSGVVVLGLARGGVVVAAEVARILKLPLEAIVVKKIGAPNNPELALGAVSEDGQVYIEQELVLRLGVDQKKLESEVARQLQSVSRARSFYDSDTTPLPLANKTAILVDDGVATGATLLAAIQAVRSRGAGQVIVAIPVTSREALVKLREAADEVIYLQAPSVFLAVGNFFENFDQVTDAEVARFLQHHRNYRI